MLTTKVKKVTIVAERILQDQLLKLITGQGAKGYTLTEVRGEGSRGVRASEWEGPDLKIEVIASQEVGEAIARHISENFFEYYAVIVYLEDAEVIRGEKYI